MTDQPIEGSAELAAILALTEQIAGLRTDVRQERHGRRLSIAVAVVALFLGALIVNAERTSREREVVAACETRTEGRRDVRAAIRKAVDVVAVYADVDAAERAALLERVTVAMLEEIPPPTC